MQKGASRTIARNTPHRAHTILLYSRLWFEIQSQRSDFFVFLA